MDPVSSAVARFVQRVLPLIAVVVVAACGSSTPSASPIVSPAPTGGVGPLASAPASATPSGSAAAPSASPTPPVPGVAAFWSLSARALSRSGRLRLIISGPSTRELRFEPKASATVADGTVASICLQSASYNIQGFRATVIPGKWACGGSALASSFRRSGQPLAAWNTRLPSDSAIHERVTLQGKGRWQWEYTANSPALGGQVKATLLLDLATGRLVSGQRSDPTGSYRYSFSYTTIFAPVSLP